MAAMHGTNKLRRFPNSVGGQIFWVLIALVVCVISCRAQSLYLTVNSHINNERFAMCWRLQDVGQVVVLPKIHGTRIFDVLAATKSVAFDGSVYLSLHLPSFEVGLSCLFVCCDVAVLNTKYPEVCSTLFPAPPWLRRKPKKRLWSKIYKKRAAKQM